jgi:hypothetical protein
MNKKSTVGKSGLDNGLGNAGMGYIVVPSNVEREDYIKYCYKNHVVCIKTEDFEFIKDVPIDEDVLQKIEFPTGEKSNGSCVGWVKMNKTSHPMIVGIFRLKNTGNDISNENSFQIVRKFQGNFVTIQGDANKGQINIAVQGDSTDRGQLKIAVTNVEDSNTACNLELYVQGVMDVIAEKDLNLKAADSFNITITDPEKGKKKTSLSYKLGDGLTLNDEFGNKTKLDASGLDINVIKKARIRKSTNTQPAALADSTKKSLDAILDLISKQNKFLITKVPQAATLTPIISEAKLHTGDIKSKTLEID